MKSKLGLLALTLLISGVALPQGTASFYYVATAVDSTGHESAYSNQVGPLATSGNDQHVDLTWTASTTTGVTYNIYRSTATGGPYTKVNSTPVSTTTYVDLPVAFPNPPSGLGGVVAP